jgi:hypothetical protein
MEGVVRRTDWQQRNGTTAHSSIPLKGRWGTGRFRSPAPDHCAMRPSICGESLDRDPRSLHPFLHIPFYTYSHVSPLSLVSLQTLSIFIVLPSIPSPPLHCTLPSALLSLQYNAMHCAPIPTPTAYRQLPSLASPWPWWCASKRVSAKRAIPPLQFRPMIARLPLCPLPVHHCPLAHLFNCQHVHFSFCPLAAFALTASDVGR